MVFTPPSHVVWPGPIRSDWASCDLPRSLVFCLVGSLLVFPTPLKSTRPLAIYPARPGLPGVLCLAVSLVVCPHPLYSAQASFGLLGPSGLFSVHYGLPSIGGLLGPDGLPGPHVGCPGSYEFPGSLWSASAPFGLFGPALSG